MDNHPHNILRVLIADDDRDFCVIHREWIEMKYDMTCCGMVHDGKAALRAIEKERPDVVLLDIMMPLLDGIGVLEYYADHPEVYRPHFLVSTTNKQDHIMRETLRCGAAFFMEKPFDAPILARRIRLVASANEKEFSARGPKALEKMVGEQVLAVGVPVNVIGFEYIQEAVLALLRAGDARPIFKQLYIEIAQRHNSDWRCVENAIGGALRTAMERRAPAMQELLALSPVPLEKQKNLSNGKFLTLLAQSIRLRDL